MEKLPPNTLPVGAPVSEDGEKRNGYNHTLLDCYLAGKRHASYGWTKHPWGHWCKEQVEAYTLGWKQG